MRRLICTFITSIILISGIARATPQNAVAFKAQAIQHGQVIFDTGLLSVTYPYKTDGEPWNHVQIIPTSKGFPWLCGYLGAGSQRGSVDVSFMCWPGGKRGEKLEGPSMDLMTACNPKKGNDIGSGISHVSDGKNDAEDLTLVVTCGTV